MSVTVNQRARTVRRAQGDHPRRRRDQSLESKSTEHGTWSCPGMLSSFLGVDPREEVKGSPAACSGHARPRPDNLLGTLVALRVGQSGWKGGAVTAVRRWLRFLHLMSALWNCAIIIFMKEEEGVVCGAKAGVGRGGGVG